MTGRPLETLTFEEFQKVEIRVGTIVEVKEFPEARRQLLNFGWILGKSLVYAKPRHKLQRTTKSEI